LINDEVEVVVYLVMGSRVEGDQVRYAAREGDGRREKMERGGTWWADRRLG